MLLAMPTAGDYLVGLPRKDMVQLWRVCAVFFCFLACSLQSITQKSIEHRIGCNCGAFAPYFFVFPGLVLDRYEIGCNCGAFAPYFFVFPALAGRGWLPRRAQRRYGATVAHLRRIFLMLAGSAF